MSHLLNERYTFGVCIYICMHACVCMHVCMSACIHVCGCLAEWRINIITLICKCFYKEDEQILTGDGHLNRCVLLCGQYQKTIQ